MATASKINDEQTKRIEELEAKLAEVLETVASLRERIHAHANHLQRLMAAPRRIDDLTPVA